MSDPFSGILIVRGERSAPASCFKSALWLESMRGDFRIEQASPAWFYYGSTVVMDLQNCIILAASLFLVLVRARGFQCLQVFG